jgi:NADPH:quinone reductase
LITILIGITKGVYLPSFFQRPDLISRARRFLADGVANGSIKANVGTVLLLSRTAETHGLLERREVQGVVVLDPRA